MAKGAETKQHILIRGLDMASELGLEAVTIGELAKKAGLSKSGLYAHFRSKEKLQLAILEHAREAFVMTVLAPALQVAAGISRIEALISNWREWDRNLPGGCIFLVAGMEFSDRPGNVRDYLVAQQQQYHDSISRTAESAVKVGEFRSDIDCEQFAFELYSLMLGFHLYHKLLQSDDVLYRQQAALDNLLENYK